MFGRRRSEAEVEAIYAALAADADARAELVQALARIDKRLAQGLDEQAKIQTTSGITVQHLRADGPRHAQRSGLGRDSPRADLHAVERTDRRRARRTAGVHRRPHRARATFRGARDPTRPPGRARARRIVPRRRAGDDRRARRNRQRQRRARTQNGFAIGCAMSRNRLDKKMNPSTATTATVIGISFAASTCTRRRRTVEATIS